MKALTYIILSFVTALLVACSTPKNFNYFQDLKDGDLITNTTDGTIRLYPQDMVNIIVKSKDPGMAALFNKGLNTNMSGGQAAGAPYVTGYTIDPDGTIDFPVLGKITIGGMTRHEAVQTIQNKLREEQLKDAIVTIEFLNLNYTVTGEVQRPGVFSIGKDRMTLIEALGNAGDLTVFGKRDSVMVVRQQGNDRKVYNLSMNSARDLMTSEAFYVKQNDIIYVKANNTKARQSLTAGNETRSISFWMSLASVLTTIAILILK
ncbi:MAG: polysaccharide biosynthesis/export family protein [Prevotella sp.]|nr:polysaccharide biosynthesis/export family protein [Prevotella sp.]